MDNITKWKKDNIVRKEALIPKENYEWFNKKLNEMGMSYNKWVNEKIKEMRGDINEN